MPHTLSSNVMFSRLMARARLRQLQLVVTVADLGSLKSAAAEVGMSQPAATQALAELEQLIEQPLFDRYAKGMRLTAAGCTLMPVIRNVLKALHSSTDSLAALNEGISGVLRVGAITAMSMSVTGDGVLRLCARHPELRLEIFDFITGPACQTVDRFKRGQQYIGIFHAAIVYPSRALYLNSPGGLRAIESIARR